MQHLIALDTATVEAEWLSELLMDLPVVEKPIPAVGTLRREYPLLQYKDEGTQERQPRTTGPDPRGQVPNLRGPDLGLYKWKPDLQEA